MLFLHIYLIFYKYKPLYDQTVHTPKTKISDSSDNMTNVTKDSKQSDTNFSNEHDSFFDEPIQEFLTENHKLSKSNDEFSEFPTPSVILFNKIVIKEILIFLIFKL